MSAHELARALLERPDMRLQAFAVIGGQGTRFEIAGGISSESYEDREKVVVLNLEAA